MSNVSDRKTIIYGLIDPRTKQLRYVGKTTMTLERRLAAHVRLARDESKGSWSYRWLRSLAKDGHKPDCFVIEEIPPFGDWTESEQFWIAYYRFIGCRLCNLTEGGEGHSGLKVSQETRDKIKARRQEPENKERVSKQSTEMWKARRSEIILAQNVGKTAEWKEKQSIAKKQLWRTPGNSCVAAMRRRRKISDEDLLEIRNLIASGARNNELAAKFNVSGSMISHIKSGSRRAL